MRIKLFSRLNLAIVGVLVLLVLGAFAGLRLTADDPACRFCVAVF